MELTEVFWIFFVSGTLTFCSLIARYCFKTRCSYIECCGFQITRDIAAEEKDEERANNHNSSASAISIRQISNPTMTTL